MIRHTQTTTESRFRAIVGILIATTALLGFFHTRWWLLATMFIGLNLLQFSYTGWCSLYTIIHKNS